MMILCSIISILLMVVVLFRQILIHQGKVAQIGGHRAVDAESEVMQHKDGRYRDIGGIDKIMFYTE